MTIYHFHTKIVVINDRLCTLFIHNSLLSPYHNLLNFPIYINGGKTTNEAKAVFVRAFSSVKQREGNSLERQQDTALKIAARYNLELDTTAFHDLGMSAFKGKMLMKGSYRSSSSRLGLKFPLALG